MKTPKLQYFTAFFEKNGDKGYTVTVPSLPGLVTEGRTLEEATRMVRDAINCYLAGLKKAKEKVFPENKYAIPYFMEVVRRQ